LGEFTASFIRSERSSPNRFAKIVFGGGFLDWRTGETLNTVHLAPFD
jgi:hypothetical protein